jgi:hypothetical protein
MLHARIAARAFNTPLLVEPSKAMAFLSGLGPRILGRRVELAIQTASRTGWQPPPCPPAPACWLVVWRTATASMAMRPIRSWTALP